MIRYFLTIFVLFLPTLAFAAEPAPNIEISEVMYDYPGSDTGHEWVEIHNYGPEPVTIVTGSGTGSWRFADNGEDKHTFSINQGSAVLQPDSYAILTSDPSIFLIDYPQFSGTIFKVALSLSNSASTLKLSNDKGVTWFGDRNYNSLLGAAGDGNSLELINDLLAASHNAGGSPGKAATIIENKPISDDPITNIENPPTSPLGPSPEIPARLAITEIYYDPAGSDTNKEWFEVQNIGSKAIDYFDKSNSINWKVSTNKVNHLLTPCKNNNLQLQSGDFAIIAKNCEVFSSLYPDVQMAIFSSPISLANSGGTIDVSIDFGESWLASTVYSQDDGGHGTGTSLELDEGGNWRASTTLGGTPGLPATFVDHSLALVELNEFHITNDDCEWIELYNRSPEPVNLNNWSIKFQASRSHTILRFNDEILKPWEIRSWKTKYGFSHDGWLQLINNHNQVLDSLLIEKARLQNISSWQRMPDGSNYWSNGSGTHDLDNTYNITEVYSSNNAPLKPEIVSYASATIKHDALGEYFLTNQDKISGTVTKSSAKSLDLLESIRGLPLHVVFQLPPHAKPSIHAGDIIDIGGVFDLVKRILIVSEVDSIHIYKKPKQNKTEVLKNSVLSDDSSPPKITENKFDLIKITPVNKYHIKPGYSWTFYLILGIISAFAAAIGIFASAVRVIHENAHIFSRRISNNH